MMRGARDFSSDTREARFEDGPHPARRIAQHADFLALIEAARAVGYRHFQRLKARAHELAQQLVIEIEAIAGQMQSVHAVGAKHLEHRGRIGEPAREHHIKESVKQHAANIHERGLDPAAGKAADSPAIGSQVAAAQNEGGAPFDNRLQQQRMVADVVFEVGILDQDRIPRGHGHAGTDGVSLARRFGLEDQTNGALRLIAVTSGEIGDDGAGAVGRLALYDDDFAARGRNGLRPHALEQLTDGERLVIDRDEDR